VAVKSNSVSNGSSLLQHRQGSAVGGNKKNRKIAPLSLPLLYQYHVWKSKGGGLDPRCRRPWAWWLGATGWSGPSG